MGSDAHLSGRITNRGAKTGRTMGDLDSFIASFSDACSAASVARSESLRPVHFASALPSTVVGLRSVIYRTRQCRLVVIFRFPVLRQKRGCYSQCLNFFLQPRYLKLFLSQNFVNVSHAQAPSRAKQQLRIAGVRATNPVSRSFGSGLLSFLFC